MPKPVSVRPLVGAALGLLMAALAPGSAAAEPEPESEPVSRASLEEAGLRAVEATPQPPAEDFVLTGGTVMTAAGATHAPGWVAVKGGRIAGVGAGDPPANSGKVIDVTGQFVTPGLIDTHSHLGVYPSPGARAHSDGNEATAPTTPGVWAEHSVWPQDAGFQRAVEGGITSLQILPGSANLIGGRGVVLRPIPTRGSRAMRFPDAPETVKMACGENPKRVYKDKGGPSTRMGNLRAFRTAFTKAEALRTRWAKAEEEPEDAGRKRRKKDTPKEQEPPDRDLDLETLVGVLEGEILVQVHCYRADDMLSVLQVADEFGFAVRSFHHALEAYKIRDVLAQREVSVSTWADWWGFKMEAYDGIPQNAAFVEVSGGRAIIHSDSAEGIQRLNQEAAKAMRSGVRSGIKVDEEAALRWITINPAWALGIQDETGSIETGKRADLVVWSDSPFSVYSDARLVFIDGLLRHDADRAQPPWADFEVGQGLQLREEVVR